MHSSMLSRLHPKARAVIEELKETTIAQQIANIELMQDNEGMLEELQRYRTEVTRLQEIINELGPDLHKQS